MKDRIVAAIHRERAKFAKRFNYDVTAIGNAIRQSEVKSGKKFIHRHPNKKKKRIAPRHRSATCDS